MPKKKKQTKQAKGKKSTKKPKKSPNKATAKRNARQRTISMRSLARKTKFSAKRRKITSTGLIVETVPLPSVGRREHGQSGDLQGLSNRPTANSESVEELLQEGNALEAEAVQGVENALDADQGEVRTKEVPEDDVPQEYQDQDRDR
jgi:hypothetical protein